MAKKPRFKMSRADRAKQFAPFSALKPLEEALEREKKRKEKAKISLPLWGKGDRSGIFNASLPSVKNRAVAVDEEYY